MGDSRFINHDLVSTTVESFKSSEAVIGTSSENTSVSLRINKTNRLIVFNYSSSTSSTNRFQLPTTTSNTSIKNTGSYGKKVILNRHVKEELQW